MTISAKDYHFSTAYDRFDMKGHFLDWQNQPAVFKSYPGKGILPLPKPEDSHEISLWELYRSAHGPRHDAGLDRDRLSRIFSRGHALRARGRSVGDDFYFRTAPSAGALYPNEIYLGAFQIQGLDSGIYHYGIGNWALTRLRKGNFRRHAASACGLSSYRELSAAFFITAIFFRSAWKYRVRALRYVLLDAGHVLENLLLALAAEGLRFTVHYNFDDVSVGHLVGIDNRREVCIACINVYGVCSEKDDDVNLVEPLPPEILHTSIVSAREIFHEEIKDAFKSGRRWLRQGDSGGNIMNTLGISYSRMVSNPAYQPPQNLLPYPRSVFHRRSKRNFIEKTISMDVLAGFLDILCLAPAMCISAETGMPSTLSVGFLAERAGRVPSGFYVMDMVEKSFGSVSHDPMIAAMARICLDQEWLRSACLHFIFMTNLSVLDKSWGPRGYRYAMINAGRLGQAVYLAATAMRLGCCGIGAFYDGEAAKLLGLNTDSAMLYLVAAGPVKQFER